MKVYEGIRVLDFTQLLQGPGGTQVLADFGAEVIKIERTDVGEIGRHHLPKIAGLSPHWAASNRSKKSLSVNLKHPEGKAVVLELVKGADIVASNFRPGVMESLGLGYEDLQEINPRIICAYASGYGRSGPYHSLRGQDLAAQAIGGLMSLTGSQDGAPTPIGTFAVDYVAAMHFAQGMMAALAARERTGRGQVVDCSLLNSAVALHLQEGTVFLNTGRRYDRPPHGVAHAHNTALYARYQTRDHLWLVIIGEFYIDEPWARVCRALEISDDIAADPRFQTIDGLLTHVDETCEILTTAFAKFERSDALERLTREDVLAAPVNDYPQVFSDPQVVHNGMILETPVESVGTVRLVGVPIKLSDTPGATDPFLSTVGQHNEDILRSLGYSDDAITHLQEVGAVGSENLRSREGGGLSW